ncbi:MAG: polysaccharide deacetylase family protein [Ilumatobacteraceae bacterium]
MDGQRGGNGVSSRLSRRGLITLGAAVCAGMIASRHVHADGIDTLDGPVPDPPGALAPAVRGARYQETPPPEPPSPPASTRPPFRPGEFIASIATSRKIVVLTFDDGPDKTHDLAIANILRSRGYEGKATFFCVGRNVRSFPGVVRQLFDRGYTIGNHTMTHAHYDTRTEAAEIGPCQEVIRRVTGEYPWAFRAAGGSTGGAIDAACAARGLAYIWTTGDEGDWKSPRLSAGTINARFASALHPGYISLRHSGGSHDDTVAAMSSMLDIIESRGYEVTSLADALAMRNGAGVQTQSAESVFADGTVPGPGGSDAPH